MRKGSAICSGLVLSLLALTACTGPKTPSERAPNAAPSGPHAASSSPEEDPSNLPTCGVVGVTLSRATLQPGVTGGGWEVGATLRTHQDCWLTRAPSFMILDGRGRLITAGDVELSQTRILRHDHDNEIVGEWRDVCATVNAPLRVSLLLENRLLAIVPRALGVPVCFVNGAPSKPSAPAPSGFLTLSLQT